MFVKRFPRETFSYSSRRTQNWFLRTTLFRRQCAEEKKYFGHTMRRRSQVIFERSAPVASTTESGRRTSLTPFAQALLGDNVDEGVPASADASENCSSDIAPASSKPSYLNFSFGAHGERGYRRTMEDEHIGAISLGVHAGLPPSKFFGVFDGHGGRECSIYIRDHIVADLEVGLNRLAVPANGRVLDADVKSTLLETFLKVDDDFLKKCVDEKLDNVGSTVTSALVLGNRLYVANTGDARTVLSRNGKAIPMSRDHKPGEESEELRIVNAGGKVFHGRIFGVLAVSRAIGDADFKMGSSWLKDFGITANLVLADPEVEAIELTPEDDFIILACDGLWDVMDNQSAVDWVGQKLAIGETCEATAEMLCNKAIHELNSRDNVSIMIVKIEE